MLNDWSMWMIAGVAAFCIGLSKAGFSGVSMVSVVLLAHLFGARESSGIALPMLIFADLIVYPAFRKHGSWSQVWPLLWPMIIGVVIGMFVLNRIDNAIARPLIGVLILIMLTIALLRRCFPERFEKLAHAPVFAIGAGFFGGVATALANAAGPVMQLYLLSRSFPKMEMIGIGARLFLLINIIKLPMLGSMQLVDQKTIVMNLQLCPLIVLGVFSGKTFLKKIPQRVFENIVLIFAAIAVLRFLIW